MLGAVAGQGGFDPSGKTPQITRGKMIGTTLTEIINVSGSGYLIAAWLWSYKGGYVDIIVDGVTLLNSSEFIQNVAYGAGGGFTLFFKFCSSIVVKAKNSTAGETVLAAVSYLLD